MNGFDTLQKFIVRLMSVSVLTLLTTGCISISRSHKKEESKTTVTPTTIVNLRTGPGTDYKVIKGVYPGTNLTVSGDINSEWIEVTTDDGTRAGGPRNHSGCDFIVSHTLPDHSDLQRS